MQPGPQRPEPVFFVKLSTPYTLKTGHGDCRMMA
jgi:hypothetical protein